MIGPQSSVLSPQSSVHSPWTPDFARRTRIPDPGPRAASPLLRLQRFHDVHAGGASDDRAGERQRKSLAQDQSEDMPQRAANGHSYAEFASGLRHEIGERSVQANERQEQRHRHANSVTDFESRIPNPESRIPAQFSGIVGRNFGGLRCLLACSYANARLMRRDSLHPRPMKRIPTGSSPAQPAGTVMLG